MSMTFLPAASRASQPWRNGGGVTSEIARVPAAEATTEFLWRVSIARVERAGPFSAFAGLERLITVIEGAGMTLRGLAATDLELRPFAVLRFDGAATVEGLLPRGPVSDLNVIYDPLRCRAHLDIVKGTLPERRSACAELLIVNLGATTIECVGDGALLRLERHDAMWLRDADARIACGHLEHAALVGIEHAPAASGTRS